jgi:PLP dependent protein
MIPSITMQDIRDSLRHIMERIAVAAEAAGRDPASIELLAVTKTQSIELVDAARSAGIRLFGENRVAEAAEKYRPRPDGERLHLIGHLQRNKAREAALLFDEIESIDSVATVEALLKHLPPERLPFPVLLEMNTSGEESKHGVRDRSALHQLTEAIHSLGTISIRGLMTVGPLSQDERLIRASFAKLRTELEVLRRDFGLPEATTLSMGMSSDFELAVAEGSTRVRIGTALFGSRSLV